MENFGQALLRKTNIDLPPRIQQCNISEKGSLYLAVTPRTGHPDNTVLLRWDKLKMGYLFNFIQLTQGTLSK
jgi:hypothetical protein